MSQSESSAVSAGSAQKSGSLQESVSGQASGSAPVPETDAESVPASGPDVSGDASDFSYTTGDVLAASAGGFIGAIFRYVIITLCLYHFFTISPFSDSAISFLFFTEMFPDSQTMLADLNISEETGIFVVNLLGCFLLVFVIADVFVIRIPLASKIFGELGLLTADISVYFSGTGIHYQGTFAEFFVDTFSHTLSALESEIAYLLPIFLLAEIILGLIAFASGNIIPDLIFRKAEKLKRLIVQGHVDGSVYSGNPGYLIKVYGDENTDNVAVRSDHRKHKKAAAGEQKTAAAGEQKTAAAGEPETAAAGEPETDAAGEPETACAEKSGTADATEQDTAVTGIKGDDLSGRNDESDESYEPIRIIRKRGE